MVSPSLIPDRAAFADPAAERQEAEKVRLLRMIQSHTAGLNRMIADAALMHLEVDLTVRNEGGAPAIWASKRPKADIR